MDFFNFIKKTNDLGVGTRDLGLLPFQTIPIDSVFLGNTGRRKWNVQRSLGPVNMPGFMIVNQELVPVPITGGSGLGISGQYVLQSLARVKDDDK